MLLALSVALLMMLPACGGSEAVGLWRIQATATFAANEAQIEAQLAAMPPAQQQMQRKRFKQTFLSVTGTLQLKADHTLTSSIEMNGKKQTMVGTWELQGDQITMKTRVFGTTEETSLVGQIDENTMTVQTVGTEQYTVFQKSV